MFRFLSPRMLLAAGLLACGLLSTGCHHGHHRCRESRVFGRVARVHHVLHGHGRHH